MFYNDDYELVLLYHIFYKMFQNFVQKTLFLVGFHWIYELVKLIQPRIVQDFLDLQTHIKCDKAERKIRLSVQLEIELP